MNYKSLKYLIIIAFCSFPYAAYADASYNFSVWLLASEDSHAVIINTPEPYPPNSSCMVTWKEPKSPVELTVASPSWSTVIEDKNSFGCNGSEKYNTWTFSVIDKDNNNRVLKNGSFKFSHLKDPKIGWATSIISDSRLYLVAKCNGPQKYVDCLNEYVSNTDSKNSNIVFVIDTTGL